MVVLGIDVAKAMLVVVLLTGERQQRAEFANTPAGHAKLLAWLTKRCAAPVHACLEATGTYGDDLAQTLYDAGHTVSVVNPARIAAYAKVQAARHKTDQADAALIPRYCQREQPAAWCPPAPELRELRALVRHLDTLQQQRQAEQNRLEAGGHPRAVEQQIEAYFEQHPALKRQHDLLNSIKGFAVRTATRLLAELGDMQRFANARAVVAYVGLNPRQYHSGSSVQRRARLSESGNAAVRAALYFPAIVAEQHNPLVQTLCVRLSARGLFPKSQYWCGNAQATPAGIWCAEVRSAVRSELHAGSDRPSVRAASDWSARQVPDAGCPQPHATARRGRSELPGRRAGCGQAARATPGKGLDKQDGICTPDTQRVPGLRPLKP